MCKKKQFKYCPSKIDPCMVELITRLNEGLQTLACCCGHGKYQRTIIFRNYEGRIIELITGIEIPRKKKFYKRDSEGFYYIPEVCEAKK